MLKPLIQQFKFYSTKKQSTTRFEEDGITFEDLTFSLL